ncbi:MAG TPA: efflux transporter outer membrane subunit [Xanthobacteraceae bacterium]|jgi:NodT family efflux transporter outer membrane factor (OMF) lipoprotein
MAVGLRTRGRVLGAAALRRSLVGNLASLGLAVLLVQMLSACSFLEKPDLALDIPPAYRAGRGEALPPKLDWWRGFRAPELTRFIEAAQTRNLDIAVAIALIIQADAQSKITGAPLLPAVTLTSTALRTRPSQTTGPGGTGGGGPSENQLFNAVLNASYEVDFWGKNRALSRAAQENAVATRFNKEVVVLSTIVSVATAYFEVLAAQDELRVAHENLAASSRILTLIRQRFEAGTASQLDVAQQESLVATVRASIPPLDQILRQNIATLAVLMACPPADLKVKGGSLARLGIPRVTPGLPSELLFQRPDIRSAEATLASANASVESARAAFFPSITLTGQGGYESSLLKLLFTPQSALYQIAANLTQPLLDGFRLEGQLEFAQGQQLAALESYRRSIISAFGDVERALIAVADTAEQVRLQALAVASSRRAFELSETRLREGTIDLVTLLQTQQTLFIAENQLVVDRLARFLAVLSLFQALGGGWMPPGVAAGGAVTVDMLPWR